MTQGYMGGFNKTIDHCNRIWHQEQGIPIPKTLTVCHCLYDQGAGGKWKCFEASVRKDGKDFEEAMDEGWKVSKNIIIRDCKKV